MRAAVFKAVGQPLAIENRPVPGPGELVIKVGRCGICGTDLVMSDGSGQHLFLVDRTKDMIISGGENVYSREVEGTIISHEEVSDCAVIGVPDPKWVEAVKAVVIRKPGSSLGELELIAHCKARIASYKCPRSVDFVSELPRLATSKLDKPALRRRYHS